MASDPATPSASVKGPEASKGKAPSVTAAWAGASKSTVPSSPFTFELKPSMLSAPRATSLASPSRPIKTAPVAVDKASSPAKPMANVDKQPASRPKSTTGADKQAMTIAGKQATSAGPVDRDEGVEFINHIWPTPETLISFADLPTPDRAYPVPQGCHRYEFTSFGAQGREERRAAERTFLQQIKKQAAEHGVDVDHLSFTFPMISGPDRVVDVFYRSLEAWTKARRFTLVYDSVPLQLSFQSGLGPYLTLNDIWADCLRRADGTVAFRGTFTILATFRGHHGPFSLPGWLQYRGFDHRLGFLGRPNLCSQCRLERDPHTIDACTWQTCPHCGGRGHKRLDCDSHPLAIQAKKFYDSFYGM
ncbi:uncharacterized protein PFL1_00787 [Pseudozyma flocculosa PF-1]|nr:uncharacterized protein PFL1_00787 [Pseudozyma flocculosa PF-1]EPQ31452.1 hypothetical protein PFL1_00787 [Pseudozyma flocculosa PF-1]